MVLSCVAFLAAAGTVAVAPSATGASAPAPTPAVLRVDQVGYAVGAPKVAYLMSAQSESGARFEVLDAVGKRRSCPVGVGASRGKWNASYRFVYPLTLSAIDTPGTYTVVVRTSSSDVVRDTSSTVRSPTFEVASPQSLWSVPIAHALSFYQNERDGPDYIPLGIAHSAGPSQRRARHDLRHAGHERQRRTSPGTSTPLGTTMDASGGWWDAGDYLKFVETTSYVVALLGVGRPRSSRARWAPASGAPTSSARSASACEWLEKMWDDSTKTLYYQVGIGEGNAKTVGDHDIWRLPQADDTFGGTNPADRYIRNRPVFEAAPPGSPVSPNLAGRLAADFGLCAQLFASVRSRLRRDLPSRRGGRLSPWPTPIRPATCSPPPPTTSIPRPSGATTWSWAPPSWPGPSVPGLSSTAYLAQAADVGGGVHALAGPGHPQPLRRRRSGPLRAGPAHHRDGGHRTGGDRRPARPTSCTPSSRGPWRWRQADPFAFGYPWSSSDTVSHGAGLSVMASEYDALTGTTTFAAQAQGWMDNVLGANPWGVSFIVGDGSDFPDCMQHQVANLVGSTDGTPPILAGAAVEGPTSCQPKGLVAWHGHLSGRRGQHLRRIQWSRCRLQGQRAVLLDRRAGHRPHGGHAPGLGLAGGSP